MLDLYKIPVGFGTAAIALVVAALSYVGTLVAEAFQSWRLSRDERRARLSRLSSLLGASKVAFDIQNDLASRLSLALLEKHPDRKTEEGGYEALFSALYDIFSTEEADLHGIIRGITVHAMRPANQAMSKWLEEDIDFRTDSRNSAELAVNLNLLASHLMLWHAKFEAWIPVNPKHALVYMADETDHGLGFPTRVDSLVVDALREIRRPFLHSAGRRLMNLFST